MKKFICISLMYTALSQCIVTSDQPRYIYVTHNSRQVGPFYRQKNSDGIDTNIFLAGTNNAVGFTQTETSSIIKQTVASAVDRYKNTNYDVAIMINFRREKRYSIDEYRIPHTSDEA